MSETKQEEIETIVQEKKIDSDKKCETTFENNTEPDPHYEPIISLPEVEVPTLEEDETVLLSLRAKLYRYDASASPPEWKERGTGTVKILKHKLKDTFRMVMRRDKTLKLCANHSILPHIVLQPSASCERAWVYSVKDFSDETMKSELLAIKFANIENAQKWKDTFEECKKIASNNGNSKEGTPTKKKIIIEDSPKLSDTFEEEKKNSFSEKKNDGETVTSKTIANEVAEKLSSVTIKNG